MGFYHAPLNWVSKLIFSLGAYAVSIYTMLAASGPHRQYLCWAWKDPLRHSLG